MEHCNFELQLSENCKARLFGKSLLLLVCLLPRPITNLVGTCTHTHHYFNNVVYRAMDCGKSFRTMERDREMYHNLQGSSTIIFD